MNNKKLLYLKISTIISFNYLQFIFFQIINFKRVKSYNNHHNENYTFSDMVMDATGNIYVTGTYIHPTQRNNIVTIKYNSSSVQQCLMDYNGIPNSNHS